MGTASSLWTLAALQTCIKACCQCVRLVNYQQWQYVSAVQRLERLWETEREWEREPGAQSRRGSRYRRKLQIMFKSVFFNLFSMIRADRRICPATSSHIPAVCKQPPSSAFIKKKLLLKQFDWHPTGVNILTPQLTQIKSVIKNK